MTRSSSVDRDPRENLASSVGVETARILLCSRRDLAACSFEAWPFDALLPRIEPGRIVLPADVVGVRSYRAWTREDGVELPVRVNGLQLGRFVLVARGAATEIALSSSGRARAIDIAERCAIALAARLSEGARPWST